MTNLDLPSRRANITALRAKATTEDERWICDEFVRLFDAIEAREALLTEGAADMSTPARLAWKDRVLEALK